MSWAYIHSKVLNKTQFTNIISVSIVVVFPLRAKPITRYCDRNLIKQIVYDIIKITQSTHQRRRAYQPTSMRRRLQSTFAVTSAGFGAHSSLVDNRRHQMIYDHTRLIRRYVISVLIVICGPIAADVFANVSAKMICGFGWCLFIVRWAIRYVVSGHTH